MEKHYLGIDVGGTTVKFGLFDAEGQLKEKWDIPTRVEDEGKNIIPDIIASVKEKGFADKISGIGTGIPAPVSKDGVVQGTANLGWGYKEVSRELEEGLGVPVKAGNDANVAALGEMWKGGGKGYHNGICVTLGTGVGGGIIVEGGIVNGANGAGGEIGHILVNDQETDSCGCGKKGCLEQYASATGIVRMARQMIGETYGSEKAKSEELTAKIIFDRMKQGDAMAQKIGGQFGYYLGTALANVAVVVDPEVFIFGGGVSKAGEIVLELVQKYYRDTAFFACKNASFVLAELGNDAGIYGAAKLMLDK